MLKPMMLALLITTSLATTCARAATDGDMAPADKTMAKLYWSGHEALRKSDWTAALERFRRLEADLRAKEPQNVDAAIYWQAYTLYQAKRGAEANAQVERLHREFAQSRWRDEADALSRQASVKLPREDDDLAEIAVEGLLNAPPERALPLLEKVLRGNHPTRVKKRALFVMSQLDEPAALAALGEIARQFTDPELREEAIRMLGVSGEPRAIEQLREMFASSSNGEEKRRIVQAWLVADRADLVLAAARTETDVQVRREAIETLGAMEAGAELVKLFDSEKDDGNRRAILQSLGVAGDVAALESIARSAQAGDLRVEAVRAIGVAGDSAALLRMHADATSPELRSAVHEGLLIAGDAKAMLKLYRASKDLEEKRAILRTLSVMGGDEAIDVIEAELDSRGNK